MTESSSSRRAAVEMIQAVDHDHLTLPGFRFHPTEDELLEFYLKKAVHSKKGFDIIGTLNLYRFEPWELPGMAKIGEREWYFFVPRVSKPTNGGRPSRTTGKGFWKATGSDRAVRGVSDPKRVIGLKKTLVFYEGRAPRGKKTDWVMNEYRLPVESTTSDMVLCKVYRKATSMKELENRATMEEEGRGSRTSSAMDTFSSSSNTDQENLVVKQQLEVKEVEVSSGDAGGRVKRMGLLPELELEVPMMTGFDWSLQDPFLLKSPWSPYAHLLNF